MTRRFAIPLSYNEVPVDSLARKLAAYAGRSNTEMVSDFEGSLREFTGAAHAVAVNSGTAAIHLGLRALHVQPSDSVLVPTFTYVASINPVLYIGAVPVFIDCEPDSWNIDPVQLERAIREGMKAGKKPKAIIVVHNYGMPARMDEIMAIAGRYEIAVLEDAAEAIGSTYKGKAVGTLGRVGILSFNNNKTVTTFGGGALLTDDRNVAEKILLWSTHSRKALPYYEHDELGYNYRMGPLNAAMGSVSLEMAGGNVEIRQKNFAIYSEHLSSISELRRQAGLEGAQSNRWISCFTFGTYKEKIKKCLEDDGVETRPLWKPMHRQPLFAGCKSFLNGTSDDLYRQGLCLPSGSSLRPDQVVSIACMIKKCIG